MSDQNIAASTDGAAPDGAVSFIWELGYQIGLLFQKLPTDNPGYQFLAFVGFCLFVLQLGSYILGVALIQKDTGRMRERADAKRNDRVLKQSVKGLKKRNGDLQIEIKGVHEVTARLTDLLNTKVAQVDKGEATIESLKARLAELKEESIQQSTENEMAQMRRQVEDYKRLLELPARDRDHIGL